MINIAEHDQVNNKTASNKNFLQASSQQQPTKKRISVHFVEAVETNIIMMVFFSLWCVHLNMQAQKCMHIYVVVVRWNEKIVKKWVQVGSKGGRQVCLKNLSNSFIIVMCWGDDANVPDYYYIRKNVFFLRLLLRSLS